MAIEKWRPAKAGDVGIFMRVKMEGLANWKKIVNAEVKSFSKGWYDLGYSGMWHQCEVLEAYLSDEEVEALGTTIQQWRHDQMRPQTPFKTVTEVIRQHFASEEGVA